MDKGLLGEKEKVARIVDKCLRVVDKRLPYYAPFRTIALKSLRKQAFRGKIALFAQFDAQVRNLLIAPCGAGSAREKDALFAPFTIGKLSFCGGFC